MFQAQPTGKLTKNAVAKAKARLVAAQLVSAGAGGAGIAVGADGESRTENCESKTDLNALLRSSDDERNAFSLRSTWRRPTGVGARWKKWGDEIPTFSPGRSELDPSLKRIKYRYPMSRTTLGLSRPAVSFVSRRLSAMYTSPCPNRRL